jgi:hypothetical protein
MHPHLAGIGATSAQPPVPTAVARWRADRRIERRAVRQRRYARIVGLVRIPTTTPDAVRPAADAEVASCR